MAAVADTPDSATINAEQGPGKRCRPGTAITRKIAQGLFHKQSKEIIKKAIEKLTEGAAAGCKLRTEGERDVLERRYKDFVHLHNAQLDSPNPLTLEQVVAEVHRRETARLVEAKRSGKMSTSVEKLKNGEVRYLSLADICNITQFFDQITKEASDSFAELIKVKDAEVYFWIFIFLISIAESEATKGNVRSAVRSDYGNGRNRTADRYRYPYLPASRQKRYLMQLN